MKLLEISAATAAILAATLSMAMAGTFTKGTVKKVDDKVGKVTIIHEELVDLEMPAMTMVFRVADDAMLENLSAGQDIEFVADRVNGKLTVVELK
ncbi:copper-binding protein [Sedimentitalea nanhaiensis]|uniref:Cu and Ag efflux protein CusF n=1 Tax=Sedimentitalea nanhaiensis TaxID=999627 RepID=A0A1I7DF29_9RHOB|nr:copper-binding protein [Sedimentitalea nanhaiensis]SFU10279.1 Cu and Ag efflux protein CusF [Sedimentitalea nanhaiensis]